MRKLLVFTAVVVLLLMVVGVSLAQGSNMGVRLFPSGTDSIVQVQMWSLVPYSQVRATRTCTKMVPFGLLPIGYADAYGNFVWNTIQVDADVCSYQFLTSSTLTGLTVDTYTDSVAWGTVLPLYYPTLTPTPAYPTTDHLQIGAQVYGTNTQGFCARQWTIPDTNRGEVYYHFCDNNRGMILQGPVYADGRVWWLVEDQYERLGWIEAGDLHLASDRLVELSWLVLGPNQLEALPRIGLNVRNLPTINSMDLATIYRGESCQVLSETVSGWWYQVSCEDATGWVCAHLTRANIEGDLSITGGINQDCGGDNLN